MRRWVRAGAVALALCSAVAAAPPSRIVSLKLCTDGLLLDLVPRSRIASVSYLSETPDNAYLWPQAKGIPVNHGTAEEVLLLRPDLVLADDYTSPAVLSFLAQAKIPLVHVPDANNFAQIRTALRIVAKAVDAVPRGETLIAVMDAKLRRLAATEPKRTIRIAGWGNGGYVPGPGTLFNAILTAAGGVNIMRHNASLDTEQLLLARPDLLAYGDDRYSGHSLRDNQSYNPLVMKLYAHRRVTYPAAWFGCGVPQSADAAVQLRAAMLAKMRGPR
jgi:iron complex transport system substrate-binding protein